MTVLSPVFQSGMGRSVDADQPMWAERDWAAMQEQVRDHGFLLVRGVELDEAACEAVCHGIGDPVTYEDESFGYGYKVLVHLRGYDDPGKAIQGRGSMPLHSDGLLADRRVDIVLLYCAEAQDNEGTQGATTVSDQIAAQERLDPEILRLLEEQGLEYRVAERDYFTGLPDEWYPLPAVIHRLGVRSLRLGLRYEPGVTPAWDVRVRGLPEDESDDVLAELRRVLMHPDFLYEHAWQEGDLLLINNYTTLHGRNGIAGRRWLMNGQSVVPAW
jgi:(5R)-carbapenem-3-carboxylate synthase